MKRKMYSLLLLVSMMCFGGCQTQVRGSLSKALVFPDGTEMYTGVQEYNNLIGHNASSLVTVMKFPDGRACVVNQNAFTDDGLVKAGITAAAQGAIGQAVRRPNQISVGNANAGASSASASQSQSDASVFWDSN